MTRNFERAFEERPDVFAAWVQLNGAIKANMDLRRYELATLAAARRLRSSYCSLMHGRVLLEEFGEPVREIAVDRRSAGLDEVDVAVMDLAEKVVVDATSIDDRDLSCFATWASPRRRSRTSCSLRRRAASSRRRSTPGVLPRREPRRARHGGSRVLVVGRPIATE